MKIYLIYAQIPDEEFNKKISFLVRNKFNYKWTKEKYMYGLYAWTADKKILKLFLELRQGTNIYTIKKKDIDYDEYKAFKEEYHEEKLRIEEFSYGKDENDKVNKIPVAVTLSEKIASKDEFSENFYEFGPNVSKIARPEIFNKEIKDSLDIIGYESMWYEYFSDDEDNNMHDLMNYNRSFGLTASGNKYIFDENNQLGRLIYLFFYMFNGEIDNED